MEILRASLFTKNYEETFIFGCIFADVHGCLHAQDALSAVDASGPVRPGPVRAVFSAVAFDRRFLRQFVHSGVHAPHR